MKHTVVLSALALFYITNASAGPPDPVREDILARAHRTKSGVIVAVTDRGEVAADTAWLLSAQINRDNSFAPLLLVLKPEERESVLKTLKLSGRSLPALIYYNQHGREISRVTGALPSHLIKQVRSGSGDENTMN